MQKVVAGYWNRTGQPGNVNRVLENDCEKVGMTARNHSCIAFFVLLLFCIAIGTASADASPGLLAATPPMGWNSWDSYGTTVGEAQVKANADWMDAHLRQHGWQYIVVDMEWFVTNPTPEGNSKTSQYSMDEFGRYTPAANRFPSAANAAGFIHPIL